MKMSLRGVADGDAMTFPLLSKHPLARFSLGCIHHRKGHTSATGSPILHHGQRAPRRKGQAARGTRTAGLMQLKTALGRPRPARGPHSHAKSPPTLTPEERPGFEKRIKNHS